MNFLIETSARHIHLNQADLETLFGEGYTLTHKKDLSQPGQYACEERLSIVGEKSTIKNVVILGPVRSDTQVEVSASDARTLGINAPVRESGHISNSGSCTLIGPKGELTIPKGVIIAKRHIHFNIKDAEKFGIQNKDVVKVKCGTNGRALIFDDVICRVHESFALAMHIDTDEANACGGATVGEIVK